MYLYKILQDHNPWWTDARARRATRYSRRRAIYDKLIQQLSKKSNRRATVLIGPRQVGKTVLLLQIADELLDRSYPPANVTYFDFSDERLTKDLLSPRAIMEASPPGVDPKHPRIFLLDEIGSVSNWAPWLKQAVDTTKHRILVTDSASTLLRQGSRESGVGRWDELKIEGLSFREFLTLQAISGERPEDVLIRVPTSVERYLQIGGFPEHIIADSMAEVRRRIRSDVAERAIVRDLTRHGVREIGKLKDLFVYLMENSNAIFDLRARAQDIDADPRSVDEWVGLLEDTLLLTRLRAYTVKASARLRRRSKSKLYAADHGLITAFAASSEPLGDPYIKGKIVEAASYRQLRELAEQQDESLTYFRSPNGKNEIDFILKTKSEPVAIEVTSGTDFTEKLGKLKWANTHIGLKRLVLVHGGLEEKVEGAVHIIPLYRFLLEPGMVVG
jgi:predicted AAA+ superfamily ATPase